MTVALETTIYTEETGVRIGRANSCKSETWRHVDCNDDRHAQVGPTYRSRKALMLDHYDYLRRAGWLRRDPSAEYVIHSECDVWDKAVFWSSSDGWGELASATRYAHRSTDASCRRAISVNNACWMSVEDAATVSRSQA